MPIYEYECTKCGRIEEALQKFSDKPLTRCRHCSGKLHRLISHSTFHLKVSGWYVTDYARKGSAQTQCSSQQSQKENPKNSAAGSQAKAPQASDKTKPASADA